MQSTDIIRAVLDMIDNLDKSATSDHHSDHNPDNHMQPETGEPSASRFKQIFAILDNPTDGDYANTPNEIVAPASAVTTDAGGGLNGSKHPHDIRVKDPSMYPNQQEY